MDDLVRKLKALADGNRLRALTALAEAGELCACQITELLGVKGATVSRHLEKLVNAGLLTSRKDGRWVYYSLPSPMTEPGLVDWVIKASSDTKQRRADRRRLKAIVAQDPEDICRAQRGERCCPRITEKEKKS